MANTAFDTGTDAVSFLPPPAPAKNQDRVPAQPAVPPLQSFDDLTAKVSGEEAGLLKEKIGAEGGMAAAQARRDAQYRARMDHEIAAESATAQDLKPWNAGEELAKRQTSLWDQFGSPGFIVAMIGSAFTAMPMNSALNAGAAAMNAINQGNMDDYNKSFDAWKENTRLVEKRLDLEERQFNQIGKLRSSDMESYNAQMTAFLNRFNDQRKLIMWNAGLNSEVEEALASQFKTRADISDARERIEKNETRRQLTMALLGDKKDPQSVSQAAIHAEQIMTTPRTAEEIAVHNRISAPGFYDQPVEEQNRQIEEAVEHVSAARAAGQVKNLKAAEDLRERQVIKDGLKAKNPTWDEATLELETNKAISQSKKQPSANNAATADIPAMIQRIETIRGGPIPPEMKTVIDATLSARGVNVAPRVGAINAAIQRMEDAKKVGKPMTDQQQLEAINNAVSFAQASYGRAGGTYAARVDSATTELQQTIPQAIETGRILPRSAFTKLNELVQEFQKGVSDPQYFDAQAALWSVANAYARAINPTGVPRESEKAELRAEKLISLATDEVAYETVLHRMMKEANASQIASHKVMSGTVEPWDLDKSLGPIPVKVGTNTEKDPEGTIYKKDGWIWKKTGSLLVPEQPVEK